MFSCTHPLLLINQQQPHALQYWGDSGGFGLGTAHEGAHKGWANGHMNQYEMSAGRRPNGALGAFLEEGTVSLGLKEEGRLPKGT